MKTVQAYRYPAVVRLIHWSSVALILTAYLTSESAEHVAESAAGAIDWHVVAGIGLLLLFVPRLIARAWIRNRPPASGAEKWMALTMQLALLLFMVVQPILGVLAVWAEGDPLVVPFIGTQIAPLVALPGGEDTFEELHELVGNAFYGVIALHAIAAIWHQFVRHDDVLRRML